MHPDRVNEDEMRQTTRQNKKKSYCSILPKNVDAFL
jgi:hypothetical protein